jgi:glycosyltransferase involved in cell wall biosynthesis
MPTYNRPLQLRNALRCLASQSQPPYEVIVCDDGSSCALDGLLDEFSGALRLSYVRQEDRGFRAGAARNLGIRRATGDLVIFVDDDLLCPQNFVAAHVAAHVKSIWSRKPRVALGYASRLATAPPVPITARALSAGEPDGRRRVLGDRGTRLRFHRHPWYFVYSANMSIPNSENPVFFDEDFIGYGLEDLDFGYRLFRGGHRIVVAPDATAAHVDETSLRDPFRREELGLEVDFESWVRNCVRLILKHRYDQKLGSVMKRDLRWFRFDDAAGRWIRSSVPTDPGSIIARIERETSDAVA